MADQGQREQVVRGAHADLAIHRHLVLRRDAFVSIELRDLGGRLEGLGRGVERVFPIDRDRRFDEAAALDVAEILAVDLALRARVDSFTFGLLIAAFTWSAVTTFTVPGFTANFAAASCGMVVFVARCSAVHFTQPPSSSATFEWP